MILVVQFMPALDFFANFLGQCQKVENLAGSVHPFSLIILCLIFLVIFTISNSVRKLAVIEEQSQ